MRYLLILFSMMFVQHGSFKEAQLKNARVKTAYEEKESIVKTYFKDKKLNYDGFHLFIRGFKAEGKLEAWVREKGKDTYTLLTTYDFCSTSGTLGPKRKEGDLQIPEGVYHINHFNPQSNFYLSLGVSYPNTSDKILSDAKHPGGAIYIHGNCVTIGCIPITDEKIKELYVLAVEARTNGQENIPLHLFPSRLDVEGLNILREKYASSKQVSSFWKNLQPVYLDFENTKKLRAVGVNKKGEYFLNN
jgi:murein L,D-transpeptidase YafK